MTTGVEREQARSLVYAAEADIPRYRSAIEQTHLALNLLTGEPPLAISQIGVGQGLLLDTQPRAIDIGIPSDLLQRRPDIMQARYALDAAAAKAGLARANRFPSISLSVKGGLGATSIKDLTSSNPAVWRAALGLVQPLFNFSGLKRQEQVAVEQYNQAAYTYEQTVLEAFADVEQTLSTIAATELETERNTELVISYRSILEMAYALYRNGMADYLDVIDAERTLYTAQMTLVGLLASQYINYATLCKALGGGWAAP
jgi:multidrug efflux system outer membrane protein